MRETKTQHCMTGSRDAKCSVNDMSDDSKCLRRSAASVKEYVLCFSCEEIDGLVLLGGKAEVISNLKHLWDLL